MANDDPAGQAADRLYLENMELRQRIKEVCELFETHAFHDPLCPMTYSTSIKRCDCGLKDAFEKVHSYK